MQKIKNDTIIKSIEKNSFTNSNGITLIALIITIIVMIILAGVTVNVVLNGGLFASAQKAAYQTEVSTIQEQLEAEKVTKIAENDGNIPSNFGITIKGLSISDDLKSKYGSKLIVSKDGVLYYDPSVVINEEEQGWLEEMGINEYTGDIEDTDLAILERYFLGEDKSGKNLVNLFDGTNFIDDTTTEVDESKIEYFNLEDIIPLSEGIYIKYNNNIYNVTIDESANTQKVETIYIPTEREGTIYKYDSNADGIEEDWIILYDYGEGKGIEIISPQVIGSLALGYNDSTIEWTDPSVIAEADLEGIGLTGRLENIEKAIYSYNNSIKTINDYCKEQIKNSETPKENIRSVGSNPENPYSENSILYTSNRIENWNSIYNGIGKSSDKNYKQDIIRMLYMGLVDIDKDYWLASRIVTDYDATYVHFNVLAVDLDGTINNSLEIWGVWNQGAFTVNGKGFGVRPIVKIPNI